MFLLLTSLCFSLFLMSASNGLLSNGVWALLLLHAASIYFYIYVFDLIVVWPFWRLGHMTAGTLGITCPCSGHKGPHSDHSNCPSAFSFSFLVLLFPPFFSLHALVSRRRSHVPPLCGGAWFMAHYSPVNLPHWAAVTSGIFLLPLKK